MYIASCLLKNTCIVTFNNYTNLFTSLVLLPVSEGSSSCSAKRHTSSSSEWGTSVDYKNVAYAIAYVVYSPSKSEICLKLTYSINF